MGNGFPDEFPFNRRRDEEEAAAAAASAASSTVAELTMDELEEVAQAAVAPATVPALAREVREPVRRSIPAATPFSQMMLHSEHPVAEPATIPARPIATGVERRRAARQTLVARATIRPETNYAGVGPMAAGYVSNISLKGIGFHTRRPLIVGERYSIKLEVGPMRWQSRLRVVACNSHPSGTYDVGAEFIANELQVRAPRDMAA
jgi:hypothetical protein